LLGWLLALLVFLVLVVYCGLPVLWTRIFHLKAYRRLRDPKRVALTFDDGPHPVYTPKLLDALAEQQVKATFFIVVQRALKCPDIVKRMKDEGHEVQIHGDRHYFVPFLPPRATAHQCIGAQMAIERKFGIRSDVYRPPWGACNLATLMLMRRAGLRMCLWTIMVGDWRRTDPSTLVRRVVDRLHGGAIIVLHDSDVSFGAEEGAPEHVIEAMPDMIRSIRSRGYEFSLVSEWL
jgi:peptidoglycan/xylan/chitin deacetylase (PgdA/CDA1 family)